MSRSASSLMLIVGEVDWREDDDRVWDVRR